MIPTTFPEVLDSLEKKIERVPFSTCWYWIGTTNNRGYPLMSKGRQSKPVVTRVIAEARRGKPLGYLVVRHTCDTPCCVNPEHLVVGTQQQNLQDMRERSRHSHGTARYNAVLNPDKVREIRKLYRTGQYTQQGLAKVFGVTRSCIEQIVTGVTWKEVV